MGDRLTLRDDERGEWWKAVHLTLSHSLETGKAVDESGQSLAVFADAAVRAYRERLPEASAVSSEDWHAVALDAIGRCNAHSRNLSAVRDALSSITDITEDDADLAGIIDKLGERGPTEGASDADRERPWNDKPTAEGWWFVWGATPDGEDDLDWHPVWVSEDSAWDGGYSFMSEPGARRGTGGYRWGGRVPMPGERPPTGGAGPEPGNAEWLAWNEGGMVGPAPSKGGVMVPCDRCGGDILGYPGDEPPYECADPECLALRPAPSVPDTRGAPTRRYFEEAVERARREQVKLQRDFGDAVAEQLADDPSVEVEVTDEGPVVTSTSRAPVEPSVPDAPGWWWVYGVHGWQPAEVFLFTYPPGTSGELRIEEAHKTDVRNGLLNISSHEWDGRCLRGAPASGAARWAEEARDAGREARRFRTKLTALIDAGEDFLRMFDIAPFRAALDTAKGDGPTLPDGFAFTATTLGQRAVVGPSKFEGHGPRLYARWSGGEYTFDDAPREVILAVFAQPKTWPKGEELAALRAAKGDGETQAV